MAVKLKDYHWYYDKVDILVAKLEPRERHLHSFHIELCEWKPFLLVFGNKPDCTNMIAFNGHFTTRRMIIEPDDISEFEKKLGRFLRSPVGKVMSDGVSILGVFGRVLSHFAQTSAAGLNLTVVNEHGEEYASIFYSDIERFEIKRWQTAVHPIWKADASLFEPLFVPHPTNTSGKMNPEAVAVFCHLANGLIKKYTKKVK